MADKISRDDIQVGDLLLFHGSGLVSWAIRFFDGSDYNHCAHVLDPTTIAQSDMGGRALKAGVPNGIQTVDLQTKLDAEDYVLVRRLISGPLDFTPVADEVNVYLAKADHYSYDAIFLLVGLTLTRRIPMPAVAKIALRNVLDKGATMLKAVADQGKETMICSAFTFDCFNNALPAPDDPYTIVVNEQPTAIMLAQDTVVGARASHGRGISPHSLLAKIATRRRATKKTGERPLLLDAALPNTHIEPSDAQVEQSLAAYRQAVRQAKRESGGTMADLSSDPEIVAAVDRVVAQLARGLPNEARTFAATSASSSYAAVAQAIGAFVTPADLRGSHSLSDIGTYQKH